MFTVERARKAVLSVVQQELVTVTAFNTAPLLPTLTLDMMLLLNSASVRHSVTCFTAFFFTTCTMIS
jgi:hypothetical protein